MNKLVAASLQMHHLVLFGNKGRMVWTWWLGFSRHSDFLCMGWALFVTWLFGCSFFPIFLFFSPLLCWKEIICLLLWFLWILMAGKRLRDRVYSCSLLSGFEIGPIKVSRQEKLSITASPIGSQEPQYYTLARAHCWRAAICLLQRCSCSLGGGPRRSLVRLLALAGEPLERSLAGLISFRHPLFVVFAPLLLELHQRDLVLSGLRWPSSPVTTQPAATSSCPEP